jgi:glycosyltransferase involved in cell wall biosynthesis
MKFSILTIVLNCQKKIELTIKSVLSQNFKDFEYIIHDGLSKDGTQEIIKKYYKYIKFYQEKDSGLYYSLNKRIIEAKGDYIGIMNAGDLFYNDSVLSNIYEIISKKEKIDCVSGNVLFFKKDSIARDWIIPIAKKEKNNFFYKIPHTSLFVKKKILLQKEILYNTNYKISSDTNTVINIVKKNYNFFYINKYFTYMEIGGMSTSFKNIILKTAEDIRILRNNFGFFFFFYFIVKIIIKIPGYFIRDKHRKSQLLKKELERLKKLKF